MYAKTIELSIKFFVDSSFTEKNLADLLEDFIDENEEILGIEAEVVSTNFEVLSSGEEN
jgi:hypothetical protein